jgi:carboxypeptidase PM20D1
MKKFFLIFTLLLFGLISILIFRTIGIKSKQFTGITPAPTIAISDSAINHLGGAIQLRTVSFMDSSLMDTTQFEKFVSYLKTTFPLTFTRLKYEPVNRYSMILEWKGQNTSLKPALLMGHYDVVPVIQGTEKMWKHRPFAGEISDGFLYGRGTLDDKVTVIGALEAVEYLLKKGYTPQRTHFLSFGHDEEVTGKSGGKIISGLFKQRNIEFEYVMDEGGSILTEGISGITKPVAVVGISEKGYYTLSLTSTGEGGHSSMPPPQTSIGMLVEAIDRIQKNPFKSDLGGAVGYSQDYLTPEMPFFQKMVLSNRWLFKSLIIREIEKSNTGNATVRTTIAPTIINAGVKENVLPIEATAKINFRILPGDSVESVKAHIKKVVNNEAIKLESLKEYDINPSPISDTATIGFRLIHKTIKKCFPETIVAPYLVLAATDSRYFTSVSKNIYRFMPVRLKNEDLKRPHGTNERISKEDFNNVVKFYIELIKGE